MRQLAVLFGVLAVCALFVSAYFHFVHGTPIHPRGYNPESLVMFDEKMNYSAYLEYGRRFRETYSRRVRSLLAGEAGIIGEFKKGTDRSEPEALRQKLKELEDNLRSGFTELNRQPVPNRLKKSHLLLCRGYRLAFEASLALSEAAGSEGVERSNNLKFGDAKARDAAKAVNASAAEHEYIWSTTGTGAP